MCNLYTQTKSVDEVARIFRDLQMPIVFPEGLPNLAPRDIAITDPGVIVRRADGGGSTISSYAGGAGPARAASRSTISAPTAASFPPADA